MSWFGEPAFTPSGSLEVDKLAQNYFQKFVAIELDGTIEAAPQIQTVSFGGAAVINGSNFTQDQAKGLAVALTFGALPVRVSVGTARPAIRRGTSNPGGFSAGASGIQVQFMLAPSSPPLDTAAMAHRLDKAGFGTYEIVTSPSTVTVNLIGPHLDRDAALRAVGGGQPSGSIATADFAVAAVG